MAAHSPDLEAAILALGQELTKRMKGENPGVFNKDYWQGRIMEWAMKDPSFKVDMFRFVDVLPVLESTDQVSRHVREYLLRDGRELPGVMKTALKAAAGGMTAGLATKTLRSNISGMAERFIVGQNAKEALGVLKKMHKQGIAFTVDLLGEATVSDVEALDYRARYLDLIENLPAAVSGFKDDAVIDQNHLGPIPRTNVSIKLSAMDPKLTATDLEGGAARLYERVLPLFLTAKAKNVFINVDLEDWDKHDITYALFEKLLSHPDLASYPHVGIVVQAYLKSAADDVERLMALAKRRGAPITVRLVKGAYWDYEVVHAAQYGHACPVFTDKAASDQSYEKLTRVMLENTDLLLPAFGSHNLRSLSHALSLADRLGVPKGATEIQMLYGMAEPERKTLRNLGHRVRVYAPVGELLPGMAYLVRRLLENTSNSGFLKLSHHDQVDPAVLLAAPSLGHDQALPPPALVPGDVKSPFASAPLADFTEKAVRDSYADALVACKESLPRTVPVCVGDTVRSEGDKLTRVSPGDDAQAVAHMVLGTTEEAEAAVHNAWAAYPAWRDTPLQTRAERVEALADRLETHRYALAALMTYESGKPWGESDADVAEAVDFCRYYARQAMLELAPQKQGNLAGEDNWMHYEGRGPTAVIAPWNFPLAILCGMATAALVAGNPVVLKPAEQSSAVAHALYEHMRAVGFTAGEVQLLPGLGETVGAALVAHPRIAQIAFTGSKAVGLHIVAEAAKTSVDAPQVKRVVCEMGGKNATIVDDDADLDEAVLGALHAAFGYAGQKCSATSRVLIVGSAYDAFCARFVEAAKTFTLSAATDPGCRLPPVIDAKEAARLNQTVDKAAETATLLYRGEFSAQHGQSYVPPAVFAVDDAQHMLMQDEFFGPIVALMKVDSFEHALQVANGTRYALTGAVFSRSPANLERARRDFKVGNLYLNTKSTGALVGRQPFGGFGMSGIGTKAGGPGYLQHFADPRVITENTMRRGYTPDIE